MQEKELEARIREGRRMAYAVFGVTPWVRANLDRTYWTQETYGGPVTSVSLDVSEFCRDAATHFNPGLLCIAASRQSPAVPTGPIHVNSLVHRNPDVSLRSFAS